VAKKKTYKGRCFCGAVEVTVTGVPEAMGYCHCASCRAWAAAPVNAFTLWKTANVKVTKGGRNLASYAMTARSQRQFCRKCGGHVMTAHPGWDLVDVYAAVIPGLRFEPQVHVHYGEQTFRIADGLPKFKDVPKEMGGTGKRLRE